MASTQDSVFGNFDFGLTSEQEERAARLHRESIIIDMLFLGPCSDNSFDDTMRAEIDAEWERNRDLTDIWEFVEALPIRKALAGESSAFEDCWRGSGITAGNRQIPAWDRNEVMRSVRNLSLIQAQFDRFDWLRKATTAQDIIDAKNAGGHAGFVSTQFPDWLREDLSGLDEIYDFGLRMLQPTYNTANAFGSGSSEPIDTGLTAAGRRLVKRSNSMGILLDVSHCGTQTTLDVCATSDAPIVASHTAATGLLDHRRGKDDDSIKAVADTGGIVGVCAVPYFLSSESDVTVERMLDHIDYVVGLVGVQHVGIGTDRPFQMPMTFQRKQAVMHGYQHGFSASDRINEYPNLAGFEDYRDFPNLTRGLVGRGYDDDAIRDIMGGNFVRVFGSVCG